MAAPEDIQEVLDMLGPDAAESGWTNEKIGAALDDGDTPNEIARRYWEYRMSRSSTMADVSESGSSRKLSQIFENAKALAAYYRGASEAENPENQPGATSFSRPIRRV